MSELNKETVRHIVEEAIKRLKNNPLGLRLGENGIHNVDGRWWAVIELTDENAERTQIWDALAELEELVEAAEPPDVKVLLTAA